MTTIPMVKEKREVNQKKINIKVGDTVIDIHSHIIPGIDDGSENLEMSIKMLKIAEEKGTKIIVATPHYISNVYENEYIKILDLYNNLKLAAIEEGLSIEIILGQEVMMEDRSFQLCKENRLRGINESRYMLMEFPLRELPKNAMELIYELRLLGIYPIIAHPERYRYIYEDPMLINSFIDEGCIFQINSGSLEGLFGKKILNCAKLFISRGMASFIASDTHSDIRRCPDMTEAFRQAEQVDKDIKSKVIKNAEDMLMNKDLKINFEKVKPKRSIFNFFK